MSRIQPLLSLLLAMMLAACASTPTPPKTEISFIDSRIFDDELSDALSAGLEEVTVTTEAGVTLGNIPERMDKWLYAVRDADNPVEAKPKEGAAYRSIGLVALLQAIATGTYEFLRDSVTYYPARNYRATLLYDKATGRVEQVVFAAVRGDEAPPPRTP
ncbi:MAG: hypothetical protein KDH20_21255 [Rhodocyclaceae bacterium]|nr:hypothetical protein [Rhodocyclaceae bacterium]